MVLIGRQEIFAELRRDRELAALITLLFDRDGFIEAPSRMSQTVDAAVGILSSLRNGKEEGFRQAIAMLARRKVSADADWIHDDLLAFSLVVGNLRFGGAEELVSQLLRARMSVGDGCSGLMSQSLGALASAGGDAPLASVLVVGRMLAYPDQKLNGALLAQAHKQSVELETQPTTHQFLRLIGEKVADVAAEIGILKNTSHYSRLVSFRNKFESRANQFSFGVFYLLLLGSGCGWLYLASLYFSPDKETEELAGKLFQMGLVVGPLALFFSREKIREALRRAFYRVLGGGELL